MNYCDNDKDKDKIISYIENILNDEDKKSFEHELQNNSELQKEYIDTKNLLNSLKNLPEVKTSRNFMVSLNLWAPFLNWGALFSLCLLFTQVLF